MSRVNPDILPCLSAKQDLPRHRCVDIFFAHLLFLKGLHPGVAVNEPQELVDNGAQMQLLCGQEGKALLNIEAHLMAEDADGARAGAVVSGFAFVSVVVQLIL